MAAIWFAAVLVCHPVSRAEPAATDERIAVTVRQAFQDVHDGFSADEVIVRDVLNDAFIKRCRELVPEADEQQCNWTLLNLRKAGRLDVDTTKRVSLRHDDYRHAAEIAARSMYDRHQQSVDAVMCDPRLRTQFDRVAQGIAEGVSAYRLRKAALSLRKARQLRPELVVRVADWHKSVVTQPASKIKQQPALVPAGPDIFRDSSGYLYIGESANLRTRLAKHLDESDRLSLARYFQQAGIDDVTIELHVFDPQSNARRVVMRRAYESELIRSRQPRFNLAP